MKACCAAGQSRLCSSSWPRQRSQEVVKELACQPALHRRSPCQCMNASTRKGCQLCVHARMLPTFEKMWLLNVHTNTLYVACRSDVGNIMVR